MIESGSDQSLRAIFVRQWIDEGCTNGMSGLQSEKAGLKDEPRTAVCPITAGVWFY